ncbi:MULTISPECIES: hypothetical protein [unclassified Streptomyces]|nr:MULTISPECIES: hypothetical protein [unclassified Streptomyces]MCX4790904.1 hypothetical protein [Streptomyces sp. NBC_01221]WSP59157.1 hypothetical protein OG306_35840 [Streptomyces sp. NBC_01241]WSP61249.1 hypothetical protein OG466_04585 [Streptomyces sp. NBC_01240]
MPKKVQRYAEEWADAAEETAALRPSAITPATVTRAPGRKPSLVARAREPAATDLRLACHVAE